MPDFCFAPDATGRDIAAALAGLPPGLGANPPIAAWVGAETQQENASCKLILATPSFIELFEATDLETLSDRFFAAPDLGADLSPGGPPRLRRLRLLSGRATRRMVFLCRQLNADRPSALFIAAALEISGAPGRKSGSISGDMRRTAHEAATSAPLAEKSPKAVKHAPKGVENVRFVWRTDANDRIVEIGETFAHFLGQRASEFIGRRLVEAMEDASAALVQTLGRLETFSGLEALWLVAGGGEPISVSLGGTPLFDKNNLFQGYRGFGVARQIFEDARLGETATESPQAAPSSSVSPLEKAVALRPQAELSAFSGHGGETPNELGEFKQTQSAVCSSCASLPTASSATDDDRGQMFAGATASQPNAVGASPNPTLLPVKAILDALPIGALVLRGGSAIFANRVLLGLFGQSDLAAALASEAFVALIDIALRLPQGGGELRAIAPHSALLRARVASIVWDDGDATLVSLEPCDQTRSRLEAELRRAESEATELGAILDTALDGIALLDRRGDILRLNRSGEALFGYDKDEVAGKPFTSLFAPESRAAAQSYFESLESNGMISLLNHGRELMGLARQGGAIPIFMTLGRLGPAVRPGSEDEDEARYCALLRDMTHWKKVERELDEARREAERASALKSDFLAKVSHEIRTPLNAILGFAEVIMEEQFGPIGNPRYKDYLKDIHASGALVMSLVNDLLDLSKIEAGKMELEFVPVNANKIVTECVSIMQPQASRARVVFRMALAARLPHICADERSLRQITLNLLSNALKFNQPGGQVIVSTTLTQSGHAVLRIRDTGVGMSPADIEVALEPFRQVGASRRSGGTGLGLPLTKALVEANRASFSIESRRNEGTLVEVAFPPAQVLAD